MGQGGARKWASKRLFLLAQLGRVLAQDVRRVGLGEVHLVVPKPKSGNHKIRACVTEVKTKM